VNDAFGRPGSVIVFGGTSDIARALLRELAGAGCDRVVLAGRDEARLAEAKKEAEASGTATVTTLIFDAEDVAQAEAVVDRGFEMVGRADLVVIAVGLLADQAEDEADPARVARCMTVNLTWPAAALARVGHHLRAQGSGRAVVLSSVAGVRVRRANFVYGSAKAGIDAYARGVHQTLAGTGAGVMVVRPGFVRTKMTEGRPDRPLSATAEQVARDIVKGLQNGAEVVWSPPVMRAVFFAFGLLPERLWRRLPL